MAEKMKLTKSEFNVDELDVEWEESDFESYDGELPPTGTILRGNVKKLWWTYTTNEDSMLKVLWVAGGNEGDLEEYNGLPVWENIVFTPKAAFKYGPFLQVMGITLKDVFSKTYVAEEDDNIGAPVEKIATLVPGTDGADCGVIIKRRKYQGEWKVEAQKFIDQPDGDDDDDDDEPEERPARRKPAAKKPAAKPTSHRRAKPEPEPEEDDDDEDEVDDDDEDDEPEEKPARRQPASRKPAAKKPAAKKPAARGRRKAADDDDEEPF